MGKVQISERCIIKMGDVQSPKWTLCRMHHQYRRDDIAFLTGRQRYVKSLTKCGVAFLMYLFFFIEVFQNLEA